MAELQKDFLFVLIKSLSTSEKRQFKLYVNRLGINVDAKFLEIIFTKPDLDENGQIVEGTGGRSDLFFAVKDEDVPKFSVSRLAYGISWLEDAIYYNNNEHLYTEEILNKYPKRW